MTETDHNESDVTDSVTSGLSTTESEMGAPAEGMVEALPSTSGAINLRGLCGACTGVMHRRVARRDMAQFMAALDAAASAAA